MFSFAVSAEHKPKTKRQIDSVDKCECCGDYIACLSDDGSEVNLGPVVRCGTCGRFIDPQDYTELEQQCDHCLSVSKFKPFNGHMHVVTGKVVDKKSPAQKLIKALNSKSKSKSRKHRGTDL